MQHLVEQHAQSPNIDSIVVLRLKEHLRCHVLISTTKSSPFSFDLLGAPPKITYFNVTHGVEQQVFWLD